MSETTDAPTPRETGAVEPMHASDEGIADAVMAMCRTLGHVEARKSIVHLLRAWKASRPDAASASVTEAEEHLAIARGRLRRLCQMLVEAVGADGPCNAEDAAERAVEEITRLRALAAAPRDAGREEVSEEQVTAAIVAYEGPSDALMSRTHRARMRDALRAARRGATG